MKTIWNHSKSLWLTDLWVRCALGLWWALLFLAYPLLAWYQRDISPALDLPLALAMFYASFLPMAVVLWQLMKLLAHIKVGEIFLWENVQCLRLISWGCFFGALVLLAGGFFAAVYLLLSGAVGFFGLLMRVVKNILAEAILLKEENDFTI